MAYEEVDGADYVKDSRPVLLARDEELRQCFKGTAFPTSPAALVGQLCFRTDLGQHYRCIDDDPVTWEVVGTGHFLKLAGGDLSGPINVSKSDAVASASSVDLDDMTGNFGYITGTTTINEIVLTKGIRFVIFGGALTINLSANLLAAPTQNTGSVSVAANDSALVVAEGSGVTRLVIFRGNGRAVDDARYQLADGTREFAVAPVVTSEGRMLRMATGSHANSGKVSVGSSAPGTLAVGEIYLRHDP